MNNNDIIDVTALSVGEREDSKTDLAQVRDFQSGHKFVDDFRECYKLAKTFCQSSIIPQNFQGKVEDTAIAIDMANRMGVSPMMVMQNLYVVKGKPSWSGQACMTFLRNKYGKVKVVYVGNKGQDDRGCCIKAIDEDGDVLEGTTVTMAMAKAEGWTSNPKWRNMPEQMLAYRAATFFARVHCPETLMGVQVEGEVEDSTPCKRTTEDVL